mmetsp:Transcript_110401/g.351974  ORF Transcript_110401/g.351974 Transcript_110401/m.351974 type:complete len:226 (+) Transcript_110401:1045-1722(+)
MARVLESPSNAMERSPAQRTFVCTPSLIPSSFATCFTACAESWRSSMTWSSSNLLNVISTREKISSWSFVACRCCKVCSSSILLSHMFMSRSFRSLTRSTLNAAWDSACRSSLSLLACSNSAISFSICALSPKPRPLLPLRALLARQPKSLWLTRFSSTRQNSSRALSKHRSRALAIEERRSSTRWRIWSSTSSIWACHAPTNSRALPTKVSCKTSRTSCCNCRK